MGTLEHLLAYDLAHPEGAGTSHEEKLFMYGLVRLVRPEHVIEVGVSMGHLTLWLAAALVANGEGRLTAVDNWSQTHGGRAGSSEPAEKRLADNGFGGRVSFVTADSAAYLAGLEHGAADLIWIDGDHSYKHARADIREALRVAELVAVHDAVAIRDVRKACEAAGTGICLPGAFGIRLMQGAGE